MNTGWRPNIRRAGLGLVVLACTALVGFAQDDDSDSAGKVKVAVSTTKPDGSGKQTATVSMKIDKTWHIYANPVKNKILLSAQTVIKVSAKEGEVEYKVQYPAGKLHVDKQSPEIKYMGYEDKVEIPVVIQRAVGDARPLELSVRFMACDDKQCLVPSTLKFTIP